MLFSAYEPLRVMFDYSNINNNPDSSAIFKKEILNMMENVGYYIHETFKINNPLSNIQVLSNVRPTIE